MSEDTLRKKCPICTADLPVTEFGVCRARKDGTNLYCKACIRKKLANSRRELKEYRAARHQRQLDLLAGIPVHHLPPPTPVERVKQAIEGGARTQSQISQVTRLGRDEVDRAITELQLWTREIRTETVGESRLYFLRDSAVDLPPRQGNVRAKEVSSEQWAVGRKRQAG